MELVTEIPNIALFVPVGVVLVVIVLIYACSFKRPEQPPFTKLSSSVNDDRKTTGKKRKTKEKKTANGHVANLVDAKSEKSPSKDKESKRSPTKEIPATPKQSKEKKQESNTKQTEKNKKNDALKSKSETIEEIKNKKNAKKQLNEKPVDYDEGDWETVPSKFDKKKKQDSPGKKEKKTNKKVDKPVESEKMVKEEVNKELREKEKNIQLEQSILVEIVDKEAPAADEKKEKRKEKKQKENNENQEITAVANNKQQKAVDQPPAKKNNPEQLSAIDEPVSEGTVAFDELGDVWKEARIPKKSKKKTRRDN